MAKKKYGKLKGFDRLQKFLVSLAIIAAGITYIMWPLDIIPEGAKAFGLIGYIDDAIVMMMLGFSLKKFFGEGKDIWAKLVN